MKTNFTAKSAGQTILASHVNDVQSAINAAEDGTVSYLAAAGSSNAYTLTYSPALASLAAGQRFRWKANHTNTGAATLNVNGLGAKSIQKEDGATALASGDIQNGQIVETVYDGTNMQMVSPVGQAPSASLPTTTKGDVIVHNGTTDIRLGVGADGEILTADSAEASGVKWAAGGGGGNAFGEIEVRDTGASPTWADTDDALVASDQANDRVHFHEGDGVALRHDVTGDAIEWALDIDGLTADASPDGAADYVATWDANASAHKKVLLDNLPGGGGGGKLLQVVEATSTVRVTTSTIMPLDDTIPQNTEGGEIITVSITPTASSSTIEIYYEAFASIATNDRAIVWALFKDTDASALAAMVEHPLVYSNTTVDAVIQQRLFHRVAAADTSARTYKIRSGGNGSGTVSVGGNSGGRLLGGVGITRLIAREIGA